MSTFLLVHGAWHGAWCWFKVVPLLREAGHTVIAIDLPSHGRDKAPTSTATLQAYTERVCGVLDECSDPVILVGHSMGGIVISQAAEQRPKKIAKLVYLTAFLLQDGQSLLDVVQADADATILPNVVYLERNTCATVREGALSEVFYADCPEADITLAKSLLVPQLLAPFATPVHVTAANWGSVPRIYLECLHDNAISITAQRSMQKALPCEKVITMETSHSPFFSAPNDLAKHLVAFSGE